MTSTRAPLPFDGCRERLDELLGARADMDVVERVIDTCALDRDEKDALWLWASGQRDLLEQHPSQPATFDRERLHELW
jgi:hypothetical protein